MMSEVISDTVESWIVTILVIFLPPILSDTVCQVSPSSATIKCSEMFSANVTSAEIVCSHHQVLQPVLHQDHAGHLLQIERCQSLHIKRKALHGLRHLRTLELSGNNLNHVPATLFCS